MSEEILRIVLALIAVIGMIGGAAMIARHMGFATKGASQGGKKRLRIIETMALDARRRVAIIKCDDKEHLIMLGAAGETVIASDLAPASSDIDSETEQSNTVEDMTGRIGAFLKKAS